MTQGIDINLQTRTRRGASRGKHDPGRDHERR